MEAPNFLIDAGYGTSLLEGRKAGVTNQLETGLTGDFFDHIDDLLDFSNEEIAGPIGDNNSNWPNNENDVCPDNSLTETGSCNLLVDGHNAGELYVPVSACDDLAELEWLSNFVEDSFSTETGPKPVLSPDFGAGTKDPERKGQSSDKFRSSSPISVLESSSTSGKPTTFSPEMAVPGRARSKRSRAPACNWASCILSPAPSDILLENGTNSSLSANAAFCTDSDYHVYEQGESQPAKKLHKTIPGMKKKGQEQMQQVRRCMHCGMTKTPQWRTGPMGPKTLCNACGVRYKSGRLLPEYRPAASPTFSPASHSNSHKKVLEMRRHKETTQLKASEEEEQSYFDSDDGYLLHTGQDYRHLI